MISFDMARPSKLTPEMMALVSVPEAEQTPHILHRHQRHNWVPWHHPPHLVARGFYIFVRLKSHLKIMLCVCVLNININVDGSKAIIPYSSIFIHIHPYSSIFIHTIPQSLDEHPLEAVFRQVRSILRRQDCDRDFTHPSHASGDAGIAVPRPSPCRVWRPRCRGSMSGHGKRGRWLIYGSWWLIYIYIWLLMVNDG